MDFRTATRNGFGAGTMLLIASLWAQPATAAEACTDARMEKLMAEMMDVMNAHPGSADHLDEELDRAAQEYGGEPEGDEVCEAVVKATEALKQY